MRWTGLALVAFFFLATLAQAQQDDWRSIRVTNSASDAAGCNLRGSVHAEQETLIYGNTRNVLDKLRKKAFDLDADLVVMLTGVTSVGSQGHLMGDGEAYRCSGLTLPPTSDDPVLAQLLALEARASDAAIRGDRSALEPIIANEAVFHVDGKTMTRLDILNATQPQRSILSHNLENLQFSHQGDEASLTGVAVYIVQQTRDTSKAIKQRFTDRFAKRGDTWQLIESTIATIRR
jgi:Domain of unknown function (DUF4440)